MSNESDLNYNNEKNMLKTKNKLLIIVLIVLGAILGANLLIRNFKGERSLKKFVTEIDHTQVDKITINNEGKTITIDKESEQWYVSDDINRYVADSQASVSLVETISQLRIERLVTKGREKREEYEVDDTSGVKVNIFVKGEKANSIIVGRFSYRQIGQGGIKMSTMVRLDGEDEVYSVDGGLSMQVKRSIDNFRDKTILNFDPENVKKIEIICPLQNNSLTLQSNDGGWTVNSETASMGRTINYLNDVKNVKGTGFTSEIKTDSIEEYRLKITLSNGEPIIVESYKIEDKYIFISSQNEFVLTDSEQLFNRLFLTIDKFKD